MKSILLIGMGRFGCHLCSKLLEHGNEIMIIDIEEAKLKEFTPYVTSAKIGDCTNIDVLKTIGIDNFDICFVCIGQNFQNSLEVTSLVKELGAKLVISKANRDIQAKFLLRNGADDVIYPDKDIAEKMAVKYSASHIFDYIELAGDYGIYEIPPLKEWVGKSLKESNIAARFGIVILGIRDVDKKPQLLPKADDVIAANIHLIIAGESKVVEGLLKKISHDYK